MRARDRKPPTMPRRASASSTGRAGRSSSSTASWKRGRSKASRTPGRRVERRRPVAACAAWTSRRRCCKSARPEQRHVDRRRRHQQTLVGADVRGRLAAANVLLARLQRQREAGLAVEIDRAPDDAARHLAHVFHARGHEAEVRSARGQRHAERLPVADRRCRRPSSPHSPGGFSSASDIGFTTAITSAPFACAQSVSASTSSSMPKKFGCCNHDRRDVLPSVCFERREDRAAPVADRRAAGRTRGSDLPVIARTTVAVGRIRRVAARRMRCRLRATVRAHGHQAGFGERRGAVVERCVRDVACPVRLAIIVWYS